jgi:hypothetical protein
VGELNPLTPITTDIFADRGVRPIVPEIEKTQERWIDAGHS